MVDLTGLFLIYYTIMTKQDVRKKIKSTLSNMKRDDRKAKSERIASGLFSLEAWKNARAVLTFLSLDEEINTDGIIKKSGSDEKLVLIPRVSGHELVFHPLRDNMRYTNHKLGMREPHIDEPVVETGKLASPFIIVVPGLAFDREKHRLGRGGGFYDRFLKNLRQQAGIDFTAIGVCFSEQLLETIPFFEHDESVDIVVTENCIIY
jgi:5-formyltetrahydrofolate cyclo-ligase